MRKLLATVALATLLSSSAHAQYGVWRGYYRAYAQVPPYAAYRSYGFYRSPYPYSVYNIRGRYVGSDPDPRVRAMLARDPGPTE
jgi:hypothetical protein